MGSPITPRFRSISPAELNGQPQPRMNRFAGLQPADSLTLSTPQPQFGATAKRASKLLAIPLALSMLVSFLAQPVRALAQEPTPTPPDGEVTEAPPEDNAEPTDEATPETTLEVTEEVTDEAPATPEPEASPTPEGTPDPTTTPEPESTPAPEASPEATDEAPATPTPAATPEATEAPPEEDNTSCTPGSGGYATRPDVAVEPGYSTVATTSGTVANEAGRYNLPQAQFTLNEPSQVNVTSFHTDGHPSPDPSGHPESTGQCQDQEAHNVIIRNAQGEAVLHWSIGDYNPSDDVWHYEQQSIQLPAGAYTLEGVHQRLGEDKDSRFVELRVDTKANEVVTPPPPPETEEPPPPQTPEPTPEQPPTQPPPSEPPAKPPVEPPVAPPPAPVPQPSTPEEEPPVVEIVPDEPVVPNEPPKPLQCEPTITIGGDPHVEVCGVRVDDITAPVWRAFEWLSNGQESFLEVHTYKTTDAPDALHYNNGIVSQLASEGNGPVRTEFQLVEDTGITELTLSYADGKETRAVIGVLDTDTDTFQVRIGKVTLTVPQGESRLIGYRDGVMTTARMEQASNGRKYIAVEIRDAAGNVQTVHIERPEVWDHGHLNVALNLNDGLEKNTLLRQPQHSEARPALGGTMEELQHVRFLARLQSWVQDKLSHGRR